MKKPSEKLIRALKILRDDKPESAEYFAKLMWPDADMHDRVSNQGRGATRGKAAWLCAGSYLGRIEKLGYIKKKYHWIERQRIPVAVLTQIGEELLSQNENSI